MLVEVGADDADKTRVRSGAFADFVFAGRQIKLHPAAAHILQNTLGTQNEAAGAVFFCKLCKDRIKRVTVELLRRFTSPVDENLVRMVVMVVMLVIVIVTSAGAVLVMLMMMMLMIVVVAAAVLVMLVVIMMLVIVIMAAAVLVMVVVIVMMIVIVVMAAAVLVVFVVIVMMLVIVVMAAAVLIVFIVIMMMLVVVIMAATVLVVVIVIVIVMFMKRFLCVYLHKIHPAQLFYLISGLAHGVEHFVYPFLALAADIYK